MKRYGLLLIVAALLTGACGGAANGSVGTSTDYPESPHGDTPGTGTPSAQDGSDGGRNRPELREPEEGLVDVYDRIFDRHKAEDRKVTLFYYSGPDECYGLDHIKIRERARKVVLTIFEGRHPEAEVCTDIAVSVRSIATLERPLGGRKVVDGAG